MKNLALLFVGLYAMNACSTTPSAAPAPARVVASETGTLSEYDKSIIFTYVKPAS